MYGDRVRELEVVGVRVELPNNQPIVLLREAGGDRYLPIWIGAAEATAIAYAQQGVVPPRPLTHDLFKDVLEALRRPLEEVRIVAVRDGVFFADGPYHAIEGADAMVILTEWNQFRALDWNRVRRLMKTPVVVDLRNIYNPEEVRAAGFTYVSIGRS